MARPYHKLKTEKAINKRDKEILAAALSPEMIIEKENSLKEFFLEHGGIGVLVPWVSVPLYQRLLVTLGETREHSREKHTAPTGKRRCCLTYMFKLEDGCKGWINGTTYTYRLDDEDLFCSTARQFIKRGNPNV